MFPHCPLVGSLCLASGPVEGLAGSYTLVVAVGGVEENSPWFGQLNV